jgi:hypothetical protein
LGSTESNNATPLKWGKTRPIGKTRAGCRIAKISCAGTSRQLAHFPGPKI